MKSSLTIVVVVVVVVAFILVSYSCKNQRNQQANQMESIQKELIFPKGEKITNNNFVGTAWLEGLLDADSLNHIAVGSVVFEPGARSNWHTHPDGQILICLDGVGYYQEKGSPIRVVNKGEVVNIRPNVLHWHGASADTEFVQLAITSRLEGVTEWFGAVSDEEYLGLKR
ncbi:cupin domain-containing protein [Prolixibacteraceae bacterium Z1-6]|uniref:Cupin domain-containing protein n=1 Tax=Draconibacterium aestuarii TaxID=2998507 RepID=A0A9X3J563_9BACT|nr:cupin domain-containing protein [Prolixibacteraceae bacterium Z1-6]